MWCITRGSAAQTDSRVDFGETSTGAAAQRTKRTNTVKTTRKTLAKSCQRRLRLLLPFVSAGAIKYSRSRRRTYVTSPEMWHRYIGADVRVFELHEWPHGSHDFYIIYARQTASGVHAQNETKTKTTTIAPVVILHNFRHLLHSKCVHMCVLCDVVYDLHAGDFAPDLFCHLYVWLWLVDRALTDNCFIMPPGPQNARKSYNLCARMCVWLSII